MKRIILFFIFATVSLSVYCENAKKDAYRYVDATELTIVGKLFYDTPNPYHRVDTVRFKGFTKGENLQVRESSGISVAFKTNSSVIQVLTEYGEMQFPNNSTGIAARGFDLYIKKDGKWLYQNANVNSDKNMSKPLTLVKDMNSDMKECLLYLPLFSEVRRIQIGVEDGAEIAPIENPFRHRIGVFGSSFTHGASTSRPGMAYPAQLSRKTGLQFLSLGCSGNSKLQQYFADVLCAAQVDALVFDSFSNPSPEMIQERLFPFIEKISKAHPDIPLIFQRTIFRANRNFSQKIDEIETRKQEVSDSLMDIACKKYKNVYYIRSTEARDADCETFVDGVHPSNQGYTLWEESVRKPILRILRKYGIK